MNSEFETILLSKTDKTKQALRYIKFMVWCEERNRNRVSTRVEKHHLLPVAEFPDYKDFRKFSWNRLDLTPKQHFLAHWMLAKIFGSQWFAFNQMRRVAPSSILYQYAREYISEAASKSNTGRVKTKEIRNAISKRTKNTVVVKDRDGNCYRVPKDDPRYLSGELVFYRTGSTHKKVTKDKMSASNKNTGKIHCHRQSDGVVDYFFEDEVPEGWVIGLSEERLKSLRESVENLDMTWITDKSTGKSRKVFRNQVDLEKHDLGRLDAFGSNNVGFSLINDPNKKKVFDIHQKKTIIVDRSTPDNSSTIKHGGSRVNLISIHDTWVITALGNEWLFRLKDRKIPEPYRTNKGHRRSISKTHHGKTLKELGIKFFTVGDIITGLIDTTNMRVTTFDQLPSDVKRRTFGITSD